MRRLLWLLFFVIPACVFATHTHAETTSESDDNETMVDEDWYQIELVVLRHLNNEQYLIDLPFTGAPDFEAEEHYSLVQGSTITTKQISEIDHDNLAIKEKFDALARSRNYRPVLLTGWKMHLPPEKEELPVRITAGEIFDSMPEIEGYITVKRNRYLHVYADLALSEFAEKEEIDSDNLLDAILNQQQPMTTLFYQPTDATREDVTASQVESTNSFDQPLSQDASHYVIKSHQRLKESRRLRSDELHYLDHPTLGILLRIIPTSAPIVPETITHEVIEPESVTPETLAPEAASAQKNPITHPQEGDPVISPSGEKQKTTR